MRELAYFGDTVLSKVFKRAEQSISLPYEHGFRRERGFYQVNR